MTMEEDMIVCSDFSNPVLGFGEMYGFKIST